MALYLIVFGLFQVLFSSMVRKINKKDKMAERSLVVTDRHIYKLHSKSFKPLRSPIPINEVSRGSIRKEEFQIHVVMFGNLNLMNRQPTFQLCVGITVNMTDCSLSAVNIDNIDI